MVRNKYLTFLGAGLLFMASACNDGYEKEPVEQFTLDYLFSRVDSAGVQSRRFLNNIYYEHLYSGYNRVDGDFLDAASDDAVSVNNNDPAVYKLLMGRYSALTRVTDMEWSEYYQGIRKANILINNIDVVPFNLKYTNALGEVKPLNYTMKAEARFLRAHFYFELVAGWHQFSGLSSPILNWFAAYYRPGKVSTGFEVWITKSDFNENHSRYKAELSFDDSTKPHERCMIVCMDAGHQYEVFFNGKPVQYRYGHAGMLEITLPATNKTGELEVRTLD